MPEPRAEVVAGKGKIEPARFMPAECKGEEKGESSEMIVGGLAVESNGMIAQWKQGFCGRKVRMCHVRSG